MSNEQQQNNKNNQNNNEGGFCNHVRENWPWYVGGVTVITAAAVGAYCYFNGRDSSNTSMLEAIGEVGTAAANNAGTTLETIEKALLS